VGVSLAEFVPAHVSVCLFRNFHRKSLAVSFSYVVVAVFYFSHKVSPQASLTRRSDSHHADWLGFILRTVGKCCGVSRAKWNVENENRDVNVFAAGSVNLMNSPWYSTLGTKQQRKSHQKTTHKQTSTKIMHSKIRVVKLPKWKSSAV
jgi:hypothetical protein